MLFTICLLMLKRDFLCCINVHLILTQAGHVALCIHYRWEVCNRTWLGLCLSLSQQRFTFFFIFITVSFSFYVLASYIVTLQPVLLFCFILYFLSFTFSTICNIIFKHWKWFYKWIQCLVIMISNSFSFSISV